MADPVDVGHRPRPPVAILETSVPGLVLWKFPRTTIKTKTGKVRSAYYTLTHGPSGHALMPGGNGGVKAILRLREGLTLAAKLGDLRWRGKPVDWTRSVESLHDIKRVNRACLAVAGFVQFGPLDDPELARWATANAVRVTFGCEEDRDVA